METTEQARRKAYLEDHAPVRIVRTDETGEWVYAVEVVDSDNFWLNWFETEYGARQFVEYRKLPLVTEVTREQKCEDLARAMGWITTQCILHPSPEVCWFSPDGLSKHRDDPPDFFTDHKACHSLVCWMAEDDARWLRFEQRFLERFSDEPNIVRECLLAYTATKAEVAWQAIMASP